MFSDIFYWIFNMSVSASIAGIVVYLLGKINKIPRKVISVLWIIPFLRMWIPIGMNSKYSLMSLISKFTTKTIVVYESCVNFSMTNFVMGAADYFPIEYKVDLLENVFNIASIIWFIIASILVIVVAITYFVSKFEIKDAINLYDNVYISDKVLSPTVYGIFTERIILPREYNDSNLRFILMHENVHIKRKDNLWRIIAIITTCIHWFNPISWMFLKSFLENMELSCDEMVLTECTEQERKSYAKTLLNCAESKVKYVSAFGGATMSSRIERILSYKSLSTMSGYAFIILAIVIGYVLLTNAK